MSDTTSEHVSPPDAVSSAPVVSTPDIVSTADARVDAVIGRLDGLDGLELTDRLAAFVEMGSELAAVLDGDGLTDLPAAP